jgi:hypothetical protein
VEVINTLRVRQFVQIVLDLATTQSLMAAVRFTTKQQLWDVAHLVQVKPELVTMEC